MIMIIIIIKEAAPVGMFYLAFCLCVCLFVFMCVRVGQVQLMIGQQKHYHFFCQKRPQSVSFSFQ